MAKRGKPAGNKRQRERDKARKREDKAHRKQLRKDGLLDAPEGGEGQAEGSDQVEGAEGAAAVESEGGQPGPDTLSSGETGDSPPTMEPAGDQDSFPPREP